MKNVIAATALFVCSMAPAAIGAQLFDANFQGSTQSDPAVDGGLTEANLDNGTATGSWAITTDGGTTGNYAAVRDDSGGTGRALMLSTGNIDFAASLANPGALSSGVSISLDACFRYTAGNSPAPSLQGFDSAGREVFKIVFWGDNGGDGDDSDFRSVAYIDASGVNHYVTGDNAVLKNSNDTYDSTKMRTLTLTLGAATMDIAWNGSTVASGIGYKTPGVANLATLRFARHTTSAWEGMWYDNISVTGDVYTPPSRTWDGSGDMTWTGGSDATSWSGGTFATGDTAQFLGAGLGTVTLSGTVQPGSIVANAAGDYTVDGSAGTLSGAGTLSKDGAGTFTASGTGIQYTGATTVDGGAVLLTGTSNFQSPTTVNSGGVLGMQGWGSTNSAFTLSLNDGATLRTLDPGGATVNFNGAITLSGATTIDLERLNNPLRIYGGLYGNGDATLDIPDGAWAYLVFHSAPATPFDGTMYVDGTDSSSNRGGIHISSGGALALSNTELTFYKTKMVLEINGWGSRSDASVKSLSSIDNTTKVQLGSHNAQTLTLGTNNGEGGDFKGVIHGLGSLIKTGSGTQTLSGANTYTGTTTVNDGTLLINGTTSGQGNYAVTGGTLGGSGTIGLAGGNSVTVSSGATIAPGTSVGTTAVSGDLVLGENFVYEWEYSAGSADLVSVTGDLQLPTAATVNITELSAGAPNPGILFSAGSLSGAADLSGWTVTGASGYASLEIVGNQVVVNRARGTVFYAY